MDYTESVIREVTLRATGSAVINYQGRELDLSKPFDRLTITAAIEKYAPEYIGTALDNEDFLRTELRKNFLGRIFFFFSVKNFFLSKIDFSPVNHV